MPAKNHERFKHDSDHDKSEMQRATIEREIEGQMRDLRLRIEGVSDEMQRCRDDAKRRRQLSSEYLKLVSLFARIGKSLVRLRSMS
jgi:hypothetical protein